MANLRILHGYKRRAAYTLAWCFVAMAIIGSAAALTGEALIFPSLGPTALMMFGHPVRRDSSPRHVVVGHALGAGSGYAALAMTGLLGTPFSANVGSHRVLAAAIALALTAVLTTLARSEHAPAGATTLIVALGILPSVADFLWLMLAIVFLALLGVAGNRLFGIDMPWWHPHPLVLRHDAELLEKMHRGGHGAASQ